MLIDGPVGNLEIECSDNRGQETAAILCHPHPSYGGSMDDLVLAEARACCEKLGISHVRFNFRGVGASEGRHDSSDAEHNGEVEDLKAVMSWIRSHFQAERIIGIGYSFGSFIINRGDQLNFFDKSILIAPPNVSMSFIFDNPQQPCDIIYGEKDTYTDPREIPSQAKLRVKIVKDGDHFFYGSYGDLSAQIMSSLTEEY